MNIHLVLLDFDGVLVHYQRERRVRHLAQALDTPAAHVHGALFEQGLERAYDSGQLTTEAYLAALGQVLQRTVTPLHWLAARQAACAPVPGVAERLLALPASLPLALLSNNGPLLADLVPLLLPALYTRLHGRVLCSGMLGGRKPDPALYRRALERLQAAPAHTLFVDDLFVNVRGARQVGLHADTVRDARSLGRVLRRHGL